MTTACGSTSDSSAAPRIVDNPDIVDNRVRITEVEAIVLRQPEVDEGIADGSQDDLVIRVHTDEGIVGIGEVDSSPEVVQAVVEARGSHAVAHGLRELLIGENPLDVERLWQKMYRGVIFYGRRGVAIHAISGIDIALWDITGQALGKPICELIGTPVHQRIRAYASRLMPDFQACGTVSQPCSRANAAIRSHSVMPPQRVTSGWTRST